MACHNEKQKQNLQQKYPYLSDYIILCIWNKSCSTVNIEARLKNIKHREGFK